MARACCTASAARYPTRCDPNRREADPGFGGCPSYLPFGAGARHCAGEQFAVAEATLTLATIARQWQLWPSSNQPGRPAVAMALRPHELRLRVAGRPGAQEAYRLAGFDYFGGAANRRRLLATKSETPEPRSRDTDGVLAAIGAGVVARSRSSAAPGIRCASAMTGDLRLTRMCRSPDDERRNSLVAVRVSERVKRVGGSGYGP
ncbi:cytochrome P450 [Nocardia sp. NPDC004568]|uniref:cytochrome P450 n=1 Tax=Nocardia sp. NPDC004568 TaxID=3154551 RepID=UPI0033A9BC59